MTFFKNLGADLLALLLWPQRFLNKWLNVRTGWWALPLLLVWWAWLLAGTLTAGVLVRPALLGPVPMISVDLPPPCLSAPCRRQTERVLIRSLLWPALIPTLIFGKTLSLWWGTPLVLLWWAVLVVAFYALPWLLLLIVIGLLS